jgi:tetratricopeptide (TPR) repeat protein
MAIGALSTVTADYPHNSLRQFLQIGNYVLIYYLVANYIQEKRQLNLLLLFITTIVGGGLWSLLIIYKFFVIWQQLGLTCALKYRYFINSTHPNYLAEVMILAIPISIGLFDSYKIRIVRLMMGFWVIIMFISLGPLYSTSGWSGFLAGAGVWLSLTIWTEGKVEGIREFLKRQRHVLALASLLVWAGGLAFPFLSNLYLRQFAKVLVSPAMGQRLILWKTSLNEIKDNLLTGVGLAAHGYDYVSRLRYIGDYEPIYDKQIGGLANYPWRRALYSTPHNLLIGIGEGMGLLGLGSFTWLLIASAKHGFSLLTKASDKYKKAMLRSFLASLTAILVWNLTSMEYNSLIPFEFWLLLGAIGAVGKIRVAGDESSVKDITQSAFQSSCFFNTEWDRKWVSFGLSTLILLTCLLLIVRPVVAASYYESGLWYEKTEQWNQATNSFIIAKRLDPLNAEHHFRLGNIYAKRGLVVEAIDEYQKAIKLRPFLARYHIVLAYFYLDNNMQEHSIAEFEKAINLDPWGIQIREHYLEVGQAHLFNGKRNDAMQMFKEAFKINPNSVNRNLWKEIEKGEIRIESIPLKAVLEEIYQEYQEMLSVDVKKAKGILARLAEIYGKARMYEEAVKMWEELKNLDPMDPYAYHKLGVLYLERGMLEEAQGELQEAVRLGDHFDSHYRLALVYEKKGLWDEAIKEIQQAQNKFIWLRYLNSNEVLSRIYLQQGRIDDAIAVLEKEIFLRDSASIRIRLGELYSEKSAIASAVAHYQKATMLEPNLAQPHMKLGELYRTEGKVQEAIVEFEKAIEIGPSDVEPFLALAELYKSKGMAGKALEGYGRALAIKPDDPNVHNALKSFCRSRDEWDEAIAELREKGEYWGELMDWAWDNLTIEPGGFIDIGNLDFGYVKGFWGSERVDSLTYRWSKETSYIKFPQIEASSPLTLSLCIAGSRPLGIRPPRVSIKVNGHTLAEFMTSKEMEIYEFAVDRWMLKPGDLVIEIKSDTFVPGGGDLRELGLIVDWIKIETQ